MKKIIILSNHHEYTYNFRKEIIQELINQNYKVYIVLPQGEKINKLKEMGCSFIDISLDRRGKNPFADFKLLINYNKIIKKINPDLVLSYTLKPNVYGALVCRFLKIPFIANITGLGSALEKKSVLQNLIVQLYRFSFKKVNCIFFQNKENLSFFKKKGIGKNRHELIPGSGINVQEYNYLKYPNSEKIEFVFISRIMKEKGIDQYLEAAHYIKNKNPDVIFHVCGFCEEDYEQKLISLHEKGIINYHGMVKRVQDVLEVSHCTVHPTYYPEGLSNVLLESAASGRPVITTDRSGCREVVDEGINGFIIKQRNSKDLIEKIERFMSLNYNEKKNMGIAGREKVIKEFDRKIVVDSYIKEIEKV